MSDWLNDVATAQFFLIFASVVILTVLLAKVAPRLGLIDIPSERKRHCADVPLVGGLAIYISCVVGLFLSDVPSEILWLIYSISILLVVGVLDDFRPLSVRVRFVCQIVSALVFMEGTNIWIRSFGLDIYLLDSFLAVAGPLFTLLAVIGLTNGFNMLDGIDGLAAGQFLVSMITFLTLLILSDSLHRYSSLIVVTVTAVFAFFLVNAGLVLNLRVFLGDAGSIMLGAIVSWTAVLVSQDSVTMIHPVAALWCVSFPVFDTLRVIIYRIRKKRSLFASDRCHLHYLIVDFGLSQRLTLSAILICSIFLNTVGLWITFSLGPLAGLAAFLLFVFAYSCLSINSKFRIKQSLS